MSDAELIVEHDGGVYFDVWRHYDVIITSYWSPKSAYLLLRFLRVFLSKYLIYALKWMIWPKKTFLDDIWPKNVIFDPRKKNWKKIFFSKKNFFRQNFYQKIVKGGHHWPKNMIPTSKLWFPSSMTSQITEKRKIAIFRKSDLYFGGHMTSWWRHTEKIFVAKCS